MLSVRQQCFPFSLSHASPGEVSTFVGRTTCWCWYKPRPLVGVWHGRLCGRCGRCLVRGLGHGQRVGCIQLAIQPQPREEAGKEEDGCILSGHELGSGSAAELGAVVRPSPELRVVGEAVDGAGQGLLVAGEVQAAIHGTGSHMNGFGLHHFFWLSYAYK